MRSSDERARLMLEMMIGTLSNGTDAPTLGHLLLGFDTASDPSQWWQQSLHPDGDFSCLTVVLKALQVC